ncbi:hypothetical protein [Gryllotalpicola koreensis]|uniref:Head decoration protein n=1 Tax=Gryllotalpicola koreensis TaxID=993086 RepID=A0ABP8A1R6_9MICO
MRQIPNAALPHKTVSYKPYTGDSAKGRTFGPSVPVKRALVVQKDVLVRGKDGEQLISGTQVYMDALAPVPTNSLVTVHAGTAFERESTVITSEHYDAGPLVQPLLVLFLN